MKKHFLFAMRFLLMVFFVNFLVGCLGGSGSGGGGGGQDVADNTGTFLTFLGGIVGGPIGYAVTGLGAAAGPLYKWFKHDKSADGMMIATQSARGKLPEEARKVFDDEMRSVMDHTLKGDLRSYVRKKKMKLRKAGKMAMSQFSNKHKLENIAKKTIAQVLKEPNG